MSDFNVRLNSFKTIVQIGKDRKWRSSNNMDFIPRCDWLIPREENEEPDEEITVGFIQRNRVTKESYIKNLWKDIGLKELEIRAERNTKDNNISP